MKCCSKCHQEQPSEQFYRDPRTKDGLAYWCKGCYRENYQQNRERARLATRRSMARRRYGLSLDEYERLIAQGCTICGSTHRVMLDHCHATNAVRAPLCAACNTALGYAGDDPERLEALAAYVRQHRDEPGQPIPTPDDPRRVHMDPADLRAMYEGGMTQAEIADSYGCSQALVNRHLKAAGITARRRGPRVAA